MRLDDKMAQAFRGEIAGPSDDELISALASVLGRRPTASEIGALFATIERTVRVLGHRP